MAHIKAYFPTIRPYNKKDSKIDPSLHRRRIIHENNIVLTANQRYGQNLAVTSTNVREFVSGPILAVAVRKRECMRTAKIGPDLRLHRTTQTNAGDIRDAQKLAQNVFPP